MKAYHNGNALGGTSGETVFQWTKIQNWKLITTPAGFDAIGYKLYFNELRYKIESLSQRHTVYAKSYSYCISMN